MKQLLHSLEMGLLCPVYLFYGEEAFLQEEALAALKKAISPDNAQWNTDIFDGQEAEIGQVVEAASTMPFFADRRLIIVKNMAWLNKKNKNDENDREQLKNSSNKNKDWQDSDMDMLLQYLASPNPSTVLVLTVQGTVDKRRKLVHLVEKTGRVVEFKPYKGGELLLWMKRYLEAGGKKADKQALELLTLTAGNNMSFLCQEMNKVLSYIGDEPVIHLADVEAVASRGSLLTIFSLMDAVAARNAHRSIDLFRLMIKEGEAQQKILSMLAKQFRDILAVGELAKKGLKSKEISRQLELHPFVAEKYLEKCRIFSFGELIKALELLLNADIANKTGQGELQNLLEVAIMRICAKA